MCLEPASDSMYIFAWTIPLNPTKSKKELTDIWLQTYPADERERLALFLVAQQRDALHDISSEDEVLDAVHLMDVELRVDEGHASQIIIPQAP